MTERNNSPNVYGIETEYTCMLTLPNDVVHELVGSCHSVDARIGLYEAPSDKGSSAIQSLSISRALEKVGIFRNSTGMLSNGGRLYIDPSGPEYATPETTTAKETVYRSFDGDKILLGIFDRFRNDGILKDFQVNRRIVDHNRTSRGIHLNTLTSLNNRGPDDLVANWIATLNVVKGAMFGSGGLLVDDKGKTAYHHSPRLSITTDTTANYNKYKQRPLVRGPFKGDGNQFARIETVTSDALNFGWPLRASLVATNAFVGILELGYGDKCPRLRNPVSSAHFVGRLGSEGKVEIIKGESTATARPLDIMRQICEIVLEVDDKEKYLDKESDQVIGEIIDTADKMSTDIYSVADQVESVGRLVAMQRKMDKAKIALDSERMCRFDYAWDWLRGGIAETLRDKRLAGWQGFGDTPSVATVRRRLTTPPQDTRAKVRGENIKLSHGTNDSTWDQIDFGTHQQYVHPLDSHRS
ncbi:proteasome accessory factor PafA2 family protein [Candidatus Saccharibacteria bacterium]|nr:proteasome accessory factor PafA2 family protein [Candidatus Saccharibacteria bacterium]